MRISLAIGACLLLATVAVFLPVRNHEFLVFYDDAQDLCRNPRINQGLKAENVAWAFTATEYSNWIPLTRLSWMADFELFGGNAGRHHLVNVAIHAACGVLLFLVLARMTGRRWPSAAVAALFLLHPLHVESVAWAVERKDTLSGLFWMLTLIAYLHYVRRPSAARYAAVFLSLALGLMAKPMLVTLPLVLLLLDYWPLGRMGPAEEGRGRPGKRAAAGARPAPWRTAARRLILEKAPLLALSAASCAVTCAAQHQAGSVVSLDWMPLSARLSNALISYVLYLAKMIWPSDLAVLYPYEANRPVWQAFAAGAALALVTASVVFAARRRPYLAVGWFWYLGTLVPVIGLVQVGNQAMADRYTYIPLVGIFIMLAWGAADLTAGRRWRLPALAAAGACAVGACMVLAAIQVQYWANSKTVFEHAIKATTGNNIAYSNLGNVLAAEGHVEDAIEQYRQALGIRPNHEAALNNLAWYLATWPEGRLRDGAEAVRLAERACSISGGKQPVFLDTLAAAYAESGRFAEAAATARLAIAVASSQGQTREQIASIEIRLRLYEAGRPYRGG